MNMDRIDRENLQFLLEADPDTLIEWYRSVSESEHVYASKLMMMYKKELDIKSSLYDMIDKDILSTDTAKGYLKKFLVGNK